MFEQIVLFFKQAPPAMDPLLYPWVAALIAGNIIVGTALWALLKYIAKLTPWAHDDKIIQIITGGMAAVKSAVGKVRKKPIELTEEVNPLSPEAMVCPKCQHLIDGGS